MTPDESENTDLLLTRYDQISQEHNHYNTVIHRTFYLSLVFLSAFLGLFLQESTDESRTVLCFFVGVVFFSLGLWTRTYQNGRRQSENLQNAIVSELTAKDYNFDEIDGIESLFPSGESRKKWERNRIKDTGLLGYYAVVAFLSIVLTILQVTVL
ncbi:hypothetical protein [Halorientalis sp. IM1011]|uniref:hypothetical protein n=1 Tax=Halorientalis sp. IM1011 TaxID=1932360 RepID=UPI0012F99089|nr:hypothetical protein [Halorientalis sp. IM1011]